MLLRRRRGPVSPGAVMCANRMVVPHRFRQILTSSDPCKILQIFAILLRFQRKNKLPGAEHGTLETFDFAQYTN